MTATRRFPHDPAAVRAARRFALETLDGYDPELLEVVELLVSELAANCVRHTNSSFEVSVAGDNREIRVSVSDHGGGRPTLRNPDPDAVAGRGLALVEMLSSSWGVRPNRSLRGGKSVWFSLDVDDRARVVV